MQDGWTHPPPTQSGYVMMVFNALFCSLVILIGGCCRRREVLLFTDLLCKSRSLNSDVKLCWLATNRFHMLAKVCPTLCITLCSDGLQPVKKMVNESIHLH